MSERVVTRASRAVPRGAAPGSATPPSSGATDVEPLSASAVRALQRAPLVERAQHGDRRAFEDLLGEWLEPSFHLALGILGNEADARDATQEAFVAAWRKLPSLRDPRCFDGWLSRIVVNACRITRRARGRVAVREISVDAAGEDAFSLTDGTTPEDALELDSLERAFERLPAAERSILVLHHLERRSVEDIATALGIPVGTAKSRLYSARRALERALERER